MSYMYKNIIYSKSTLISFTYIKYNILYNYIYYII